MMDTFGVTNDRDDDLENTHCSSTEEEHVSTAEAIDQEQTRDGHDDVDNIGNNGSCEASNTGALKELSAVVEDL